ncbi:MAG TPA: hypothetical protein PK478_00680 [Nitrospira sp.]|nr:hypothetical protein [Nitrospira sp.]
MEDTTAALRLAARGWPTLLRFDTSEALEIYVEQQLNEKGIDPTVALIDSNGTQTIAMRQAPSGDDYVFTYCMERNPDTGTHHCCECSHEGGACPEFTGEWSPTFPVWIMEPVR